MKPLRALSPDIAGGIDFVLCDLDDTLTLNGRLPAASYSGLEQLAHAGKKVIIVTGRPAGWCDMIARFWPVEGVVGENGAFYFRYLATKNRMVRNYLVGEKQRERDRAKLAAFFAELRKTYPKLTLASDQPFRVSDIAIDICEDVAPLSKDTVQDIVERLEKRGATVKVSSIHINAWIGEFDKLSMLLTLLKDAFKIGAAKAKNRSLYVGDSPNDEPMFVFFPHAVGVRNIENFAAQMRHLPCYVTRAEGGVGFLEVARSIVRASAPPNPTRGRSRRFSSPRRR
jgi:HAD superfamily hydrolase (TIGR01484 family)